MVGENWYQLMFASASNLAVKALQKSPNFTGSMGSQAAKTCQIVPKSLINHSGSRRSFATASELSKKRRAEFPLKKFQLL